MLLTSDKLQQLLTVIYLTIFPCIMDVTMKYQLICLILLFTMSCAMFECPDHCVCNKNVLECDKTLPSFIPENVTIVTVHNVPLNPQMNFTYTDWCNVTYFSLTLGDVLNADINVPSRTLQDDEFVGLQNVEHFKLSCCCYLSISGSAFYGLTNVRVLDLSHNSVSNSIHDDISAGLERKNILPKLSELFLSEITAPTGDLDITLDRLHTALQTKPLRLLDLSGTNFYFSIYNHSVPPTSVLPQLQTLNISRAGKAFYSLPWFYHYYTQRPEAVFTGLKVLDASYPYFPISEEDCMKEWSYYGQFCRAVQSEDNVLPYKLTELYLGNLFQSTLQELRGSYNTTHVCVSFPCFPANNTVCTRAKLNQIQKLDISNNSFTYIQPELLEPLKRLNYLNICNNKLGPALTEDGYARSFFHALQSIEVLLFCNNNITVIRKQQLAYLRNLRILDLSHNGLISIDFGIDHSFSLETLVLSYNKIDTIGPLINLSELRILALSHNKLTSLNIGIEHLNALELADLSYNKIVVVDINDCEMLRNLHFYIKTSNTSLNYNVNETGLKLEGNPVSCSCDNLCLFNFLQDQNGTYICQTDNETNTVDFLFVKHLEYSCKDTIVKVAFTADAIATIVIIALAAYVLKKERQRVRLKRLKESGIEQYRTRRKKFAAFLLFSGDDEDFVMTRVYRQLETGLRQILNTESDCVATGGTHFRPGHSIQDEIVRCVEESSVVIFFLSDTFIHKSWCRSEVHKAFCDEKPIILMIMGKLNMKSMPRVLRKHYETFTRVHWCLENGEYVMRPNMEHFCETVVGLMGKKETE